ncbi:helix-turn-helix domain-containing protein [Capnocytophaga sp. ARDL2]|uniref:helix-turn-helix domain-containing protein n=1 Tax=Capnocytophaga sp. ARDL2 TaxID=3238809 RepID=UPI0035579DD9
MEIRAFIEKGKDGMYSIYVKNNPLPFGLLGTGATIEEAKEDFYISIEEMQEIYEEENKDFPLFSVVFDYDTTSFLEYYNQYITLSGLGKLTGINKAQLSHYIQGVRNPSLATTQKIQTALHKFADELKSIQFY